MAKEEFVNDFIIDVPLPEKAEVLLADHRIYPNPFNPEVNISFSTASNNNVKINIYNIRGQKITTLYDGKLSAGQHTFHWNGKDSNGRSAASGIYLLRVESGNEHHTLKMILMK